MDGEVLYHELVHKTEEEKHIIKKKRDEKMKLKEKRRKVQEDNKKTKEKKKEDHKTKSLKGMKKKIESEEIMKKLASEADQTTKIEEDDDAEYFRQEVGIEPEKGTQKFVYFLYIKIVFEYFSYKQCFDFSELFDGKKRKKNFTPKYKNKKAKTK